MCDEDRSRVQECYEVIYDYQCDKCLQIIEVSQGHQDVGDFGCGCSGINKRYFGNMTARNFMGIENFNKEIFDSGSNRYIPSSQIDTIGKAEGKIWMSHDEAAQEAAKNKTYIMEKENKRFKKKLENDLISILNK